jgi:hypothetical protein
LNFCEEIKRDLLIQDEEEKGGNYKVPLGSESDEELISYIKPKENDNYVNTLIAKEAKKTQRSSKEQ